VAHYKDCKEVMERQALRRENKGIYVYRVRWIGDIASYLRNLREKRRKKSITTITTTAAAATTTVIIIIIIIIITVKTYNMTVMYTYMKYRSHSNSNNNKALSCK
jgi:hypothetical protein